MHNIFLFNLFQNGIFGHIFWWFLFINADYLIVQTALMVNKYFERELHFWADKTLFEEISGGMATQWARKSRLIMKKGPASSEGWLIICADGSLNSYTNQQMDSFSK